MSSWIVLSSLLIIKNPSVSPLHHNLAPPCQVQVQFPPSLLRSTHDFVREDAYKPTLSPLYKGPYLAVSHSPKYLFFQVGSKTMVDLIASETSGSSTLGSNASGASGATYLTARGSKKKVHFSPPAPVESSPRRNPRRIDKHLSSLQSLKMLGGSLWRS